MTIVKHCPACGRRTSVDVSEAGYIAWMQGTLYARDAFPDLPEEQRITLLTGYHSSCWEEEDMTQVGPVEIDWPADIFIEG